MKQEIDISSVAKRLDAVEAAFNELVASLEGLNDAVQSVPHSPDYDARDVVDAVLHALRPLMDRG